MDGEKARTEKNIENVSSIKYKFRRCPCKMHGNMFAGAWYGTICYLVRNSGFFLFLFFLRGSIECCFTVSHEIFFLTW
jgi:hypothetical protein